jgi:hypothetical protein
MMSLPAVAHALTAVAFLIQIVALQTFAIKAEVQWVACAGGRSG